MLLDMEWIETENKTREITQMAAVRVDDSWSALESFDAIVHPMSLASCDPSHIGFSGYPLKRFENGETEADAVRRFSKWLKEDDSLCVWHHDTGDVLAAAWRAVFQERISFPILRANRKVCRFVQNGIGSLMNLYTVAKSQRIPVETPHRSADDVSLMRRLFSSIELSQKKLRKELVSVERTSGPADRNRAIFAKAQYRYIYTHNSPVFHTKDCPRILHANTIEGCVYYKTAMKSRRPCKVCKPPPDARASIPGASDVTSPKTAPSSTVDYREVIRVRLLGGETIEARRGNILGYCHNLIHPGKLTRSIMEGHKCIAKQCRFLEKYEDVPFWVEREKRQIAKRRAKQRKKEKKAALLNESESMIKLRDDFQRHADCTDSDLDVIRVEHRSLHTYKVFYVSDNRFADGNKFPAFLDALKKSYERRRIILRHIKDLDGHFVTRDEYYSRKR